MQANNKGCHTEPYLNFSIKWYWVRRLTFVTLARRTFSHVMLQIYEILAHPLDDSQMVRHKWFVAMDIPTRSAGGTMR